MTDDFVEIATLTKPHGVRGEMKLNVSHEYLEFLVGCPEVVVGGTPHTVAGVRGSADSPIISFEGIDDRTAADSLRGASISAPRSELPQLEEGEVYLVDLIGLDVHNLAGDRIGKVTDAKAMPANAIVEVDLGERSILVSFTRDAIPDMSASAIVIDTEFLGL